MSDDRNLVSNTNATQARLTLPAIIPMRPQAEPKGETHAGGKKSIRARVAIAAAALALAAAGAGTFLAGERQRQASAMAERAKETQALAKAVGALSDRLTAIEGVKPHEELASLQRSIGEIRASVPNSKQLGDALAELSGRVEALNREESQRVEKLRERLDREPRATELSARIENLEKKVVAAAPPAAPPAQPNPSNATKLGRNVDMEPTASIRRPRPLLQGYVVLGARGQVALVEGRYGERAVRPGDYLPGAGRVERIERQAGNWVVLTDQGLIAGADGY